MTSKSRKPKEMTEMSIMCFKKQKVTCNLCVINYFNLELFAPGKGHFICMYAERLLLYVSYSTDCTKNKFIH